MGNLLLRPAKKKSNQTLGSKPTPKKNNQILNLKYKLMNWLVLEPDEYQSNGEYCLHGRKVQHINQVLKSQKGDRLRALVYHEALGEAEILTIDKNSCRVFFHQHNNESVVNCFNNLRLFFALQRPQTIKKILQLSSCLGVASINFFISEKSQKSYLNSPIWQPANIRQECILGMEQGGQVYAPEVQLFKNKYQLQPLIQGQVFILHPESNLPYLAEITMVEPPVSLVFGPESGFLEKDIEFFILQGARLVQISRAILRTENALSFALSQFEANAHL